MLARRAGDHLQKLAHRDEVAQEGVGDHGCEYMTGGRVAVLGATGRNFAAGMSGGIAYVLEDENNRFRQFSCNRESVDLDPLTAEDAAELLPLIRSHFDATGSSLAQRLLADPDAIKEKFVKVMPTEYKRALARLAPDDKQVEG